ncbi:MAG: hypothetical protein M3P31_05000 [Actinomycetota bacterium]|nr:hypothetical protein [Actinomycetota bacterium]
MTLPARRPSLWTALVRTVRPSYGARRNAADGLRDVRHDRSDRAQAMAAFARRPSPVEDRRR